jgi:nicotinamidase-related amidase
VVENTLLLIRAAKAMSVPVALTTQYARGLGAIVPEILAEAGVTPIDKTAFGCFGSDAFLAHLTRWPERKQLLVAGVESHICVTQTVLGAIAHGYAVHVAGDATSSRTEANWKAGLHRMEQAGAVLSTAEMAIYELLARSDDAAFKAILPLLKG